MKTIYLVSSYRCYEGADPVKAFASKEAADAFSSLCEKHHAARPEYPEPGSPDAAYVKHERALKRWEKNNPAPGHDYVHGFQVSELEMEGAP